MWACVAAIVVILLASAIGVWFKSRGFDWQIRIISAKLDKYMHSRKKNHSKGCRLLKRLYSLLNAGIVARNAANVYRVVDLLKFAYGSGVQNNNEYQRLGSIVIASMRNKQPDIAGIVMGAFKPLLRTADAKSLPGALDQLTMIAVISARSKYSFILAKVLEDVFDASMRLDFASDRATIFTFMRAIKTIGLMGLRRHDYDLFRELTSRLIAWSASFRRQGLEQDFDGLLTVWLHHLAKSNDIDAFDNFSELVFALQENKDIKPPTIVLLMNEALNAAGTASLNQNNKMPQVILRFLLEIAERERDSKLWKKSVKVAGQVASLALSRRKTADAICIALPLLDKGRNILSAELKFGEYGDDSRRQNLFTVIKECIIMAELKSRQDMTSSAGEVVAEIYETWRSLPETIGIQKSIKQFCQLLLLFWQNTRQRQARRGMPDQSGLTQPMLVSEKDRKRLGL